MLFIHPMWSCENQRQGMQTCTPLGYNLRVLGDLLGLGGLVMLLVVMGLLINGQEKVFPPPPQI